jgi:hypothetical protein
MRHGAYSILILKMVLLGRGLASHLGLSGGADNAPRSLFERAASPWANARQRALCGGLSAWTYSTEEKCLQKRPQSGRFADLRVSEARKHRKSMVLISTSDPGRLEG